MSDLKRKVTVRKPNAGGPRPKKHISIVEQGIKQLYPENDATFVPEVDIVFVPGLGAHPKECWEEEHFKWPTDSLAKDFPRSRILLYMYESCWQGAFKVRQFMDNLSMGLLMGLAAHRDKVSLDPLSSFLTPDVPGDRLTRKQESEARPIVFIGHSMGGLVIAKAVVLADFHRKRFPIMFEAIAATIFFWDAVQRRRCRISCVHLRELVDEFLDRVRQVSPNIAITCFWEERDTSLSSLAKLPSVFGNIPLPAKYAMFVTRESATLEGYFNMGLAAGHRDLVKFKSAQDPHFQYVRHEVKDRINAAESTVKNRMNSVRGVDQEMTNAIDDALDGGSVPARRKAAAGTFSPSDWVTKDPEYIAWLAEDKTGNGGGSETVKPVDCLWVRAHEGRGKTSASMAVISDYEKRDASDRKQNPVRIAYFFCTQSQYSCTAEDILKSLIRQLNKQQGALAFYAKSFIKKAKGDKSPAQVTIENLWQTLQEMLTDTLIGSKVIFVLNNLHVLPENSASTIKLMNFIQTELSDMNEMGSRQALTRWFITSRESHIVAKALNVDGVRLVDLEDPKYENQVQIALKRTAKSKVESLVKKKKYNKALAYYVSSLLGKRAQNTQWIEISCVQLFELEPAESDLKVRRVLETLPQDLQTLLSNAWRQVFQENGDDCDRIKEMLRAMVLTYEDPTEDELGVLAGLFSSDEKKMELHRLIELCKPLLSTTRNGPVSFLNGVVKSHLLENAEELLGMSAHDIKVQHGILALRCLDHVKQAFDVDIDLENESDGEDDDAEEEEEEAAEDGDGGSGDNAEEDSDSDESDGDDESYDVGAEWDDGAESSNGDNDPEVYKIWGLAMAYTVKHWLRHASKATIDIAEDLSVEQGFWEPDSRIRRRWLLEFHRLTNILENDFHASDVKNWTALHIVSAVGFRDLVTALINNGHEGEIAQRDELDNTPLHLAACYGRTMIAQALLDRESPIDDGIEIDTGTPLHMAALGGHVDVMKLLIGRGANANAVSDSYGPVVSAAISSGNREAVKLLVAEGVSLTVDEDRGLDPPLALAALLSDMSMFEYLVEQYADKLPAQEYSKALVKSAEAGRADVLNTLLKFEHEHQYFQQALEAAVGEENWEVATVLLEKQPGLDCNNLFRKAATAVEDQNDLLGVAWAYSNGAISQETVDSALYHATDCEKKTTVELLLGEPYRGSPNATGPDYGNALTAAAYDGSEDIIAMLLEAGADVNDPAGWALQTAAGQGHMGIVKDFLERGAHANAFTKDSNFAPGTALQGACEAGRLDIAELLFEHGADPDLGGGDEGPPVIAATKHNEEEILRLLVRKGAALNLRGGHDGSTPLTNAAEFMYRDAVELLLDAGADLDLADAKGNTALTVACAADDDAIARLLLRRGADLLHVNHDGRNALQVALKEGADDCLAILVERTSALFAALRSAMQGGNMAVAGVVRSVEASKQGLEYDDDDDEDGNGESGGLSYDDDDRTGEHNQQHGIIEQVSEELKSALGTQISLYQQYSPGHSETENISPAAASSPSSSQAPRFSSQAGPGWQQWPQQQSPPLPSISSISQDHTQRPADVPVGLSISPPPHIRRKPAPAPISRPSYEGLIHASSNHSNTPSPPPSLTPGRPPRQYVQQQTPPPSSSSSSQQYATYNPAASPRPQQSASPSYFPSQSAAGSGTPPPIAPKPTEYTTQGGGGYYGSNPVTGGGIRRCNQGHNNSINSNSRPITPLVRIHTVDGTHNNSSSNRDHRVRRNGVRCWTGLG
ncbi:uncharacterized protein PG986_000076 [Apiospora aurea]|uniref:Nephrocystin 3-like N-terminal domain-containing protein n=1 Tax=Apiospora aurea TaxID=335848 RepID=A0ABR1QT11_9PEZI